MNKLAVWTLGLILSCGSSQTTVSEASRPEKEGNPIPYAATITQKELEEQLYTYASDAFEGRETGTPGQKKAVAYLKSQYEALGVPAAKRDGDYFQKVPLKATKAPTGHITINGSTFPIGDDVLTFTKALGQYDEIVYAGYGIEAGDYSDYKNINVKGKLVLLKFGEPLNDDGTYRLSGTQEPSAWSDAYGALEKKMDVAEAKGAKGVLYFDTDYFFRYKKFFNALKTGWKRRMFVKKERSDPLIFLLNTKAATALKKDIEEDHQPQTVPTDLAFTVEGGSTAIDSENVIAYIRGSEKPQEYVVLSAHLDHIGITADGQINNGADDDGSGNVALLEIAEAFTKAAEVGEGPKRSVVFLHVTAEEKGLLGSQYYTDYDPVFPLSQTVANLNIDMIGRIDPDRKGDRNYVYLIGSDKLSTELHQLSEAVNTRYSKLELDYTYNEDNDPNRFYYRSDHYNFAKHEVPVIFYFNGIHADYHRPSDTPDKINYDLLENRTRLIFHTAWALANRKNRVTVDKTFK